MNPLFPPRPPSPCYDDPHFEKPTKSVTREETPQRQLKTPKRQNAKPIVCRSGKQPPSGERANTDKEYDQIAEICLDQLLVFDDALLRELEGLEEFARAFGRKRKQMRISEDKMAKQLTEISKNQLDPRTIAAYERLDLPAVQSKAITWLAKQWCRQRGIVLM
ncbi:hypothetical protein QR680_010619 [Steinernema hermaphroditum]|uniref:POU-specific domain-containing protein n=1 Tax=Steinernema hermaphroditum TaxID=289476 RepID=A0AA39IPL0_9BILA|nr:hypothetical protein QR680_010619 [Steinernema hermaphroditum]